MTLEPDHMRVFERRRLSEGEIALGRGMFGDDVKWERVRIVQFPALFFFAMVPFGNTIVYAKLRARADFAKASSFEQGVFIHELTHVWQAARGVVLAFAKLRALGRDAYRYQARWGAALKEYNIESQAEIARHLFEARIGKPDREAPPAQLLEEIWAKR